MNKVFLHGNVGRDMEIKDGQGWSKGRFSLATTKRRKKGEEWVDETAWHNVTLWNPTEHLKKSIVKGSAVLIEGEIEYWEKDDKRGTEIVAQKATVTKYADGEQRQPLQPKKMDMPQPQDDGLPF